MIRGTEICGYIIKISNDVPGNVNQHNECLVMLSTSSFLHLLPNQQMTVGLFKHSFSYFKKKKCRLREIKSFVQVPKAGKNKVRIPIQTGYYNSTCLILLTDVPEVIGKTFEALKHSVKHLQIAI